MTSNQHCYIHSPSLNNIYCCLKVFSLASVSEPCIYLNKTTHNEVEALNPVVLAHLLPLPCHYNGKAETREKPVFVPKCSHQLRFHLTPSHHSSETFTSKQPMLTLQYHYNGKAQAIKGPAKQCSRRLRFSPARRCEPCTSRQPIMRRKSRCFIPKAGRRAEGASKS
jgi:hypothetical protein